MRINVLCLLELCT